MNHKGAQTHSWRGITSLGREGALETPGRMDMQDYVETQHARSPRRLSTLPSLQAVMKLDKRAVRDNGRGDVRYLCFTEAKDVGTRTDWHEGGSKATGEPGE